MPLTVIEAGRAAAFLFVDLEMETGGDVLLRHVPGQPQLDQGPNFVGHHLVAGGLDRGNDVVYEHQPILPGGGEIDGLGGRLMLALRSAWAC